MSPLPNSRVLAAVAVGLLATGCGTGSWWRDGTAGSGIEFTYHSGATGGTFMPEIIGAGVGLIDFDGDGDLDVFLANGNENVPGYARSSAMTNRLYRQDEGGRFTDVTQASGLGDTGYGMGVAVGDIDNDGDLDVYVTNVGPDQLYRNRGDGTFENVTRALGIDVPGWSASAAFCDYDLDGLLDLYVTQYVEDDPTVKCRTISGRPEYCGPKSFRPTFDVLLHNDGGRFTDVSEAAGLLTSPPGASFGVVCHEMDENGWPDFYVTNDGYPNDLWLNQGDGTFVNRAVALGAAYNALGRTMAGMGVFSADLDGDTLLDLFVTNLTDETNTYYHAKGTGQGFLDETGPSGLGESSLVHTGFGTVALDAELDGDLDIAVANGHVKGYDPVPGVRLPPPWDRLAERNLFYVNDGQGRFALSPTECGPLCSEPRIGRGLAQGDVDRDGDVDLLLGNIASAARLYYNEAPRAGRWLEVRAVDPRYRRDAVAAFVRVTVGGRTIVRVVAPASSYLSSSAPEVHFGLGEVEAVDAVEVEWPDGLTESFDVDCVDCFVTLERGQGTPR